MRQILALTVKDLRILPRIRMAFFFTFLWPVIVAVLFGFAFGGSGDGMPKAMPLALVDEDATDSSRAFVQRLEAGGAFAFTAMPRADAEAAVRRGQRTAFIVIPQGFGVASERMFYGTPREVLVGADPSRKAEAGMIEGLLMKAAAEDMQRALGDAAASSRMVDTALHDLRTDPGGAPPELAHFLGELKAFIGAPAIARGPAGGGMMQWQPLKVTAAAVTRERRGPENAFEITFPQGVLWGLIGCAMSFGLSLVSERTRGTFLRLAMSPLSRTQILAGKALACFVAMLVVQALLYAIGVALFGIRPSSWPMLALGSLCASLGFCGFMMLVATLGQTEQAASGTAWAILMPLSLVGGGMVPQFVMPPWMAAVGTISPVKWAIRAIEGGLWRQFTLAEMAGPCAFLLVFGAVCFVLGTRRLTVD
jgi:ABC-2 type transport system permease protein